MSAAQAAATAESAPEAGARKSKKNILVLALAGLLVAGGAGGGAAWYFLGQRGEQAKGPAEAKKKAAKPLFLTLEPFTVNLQDQRGERFAQIGITLQFEDPHVEIALKDVLPALRNDILLLISARQIEDLLTLEGKQKLSEDILRSAIHALGAGHDKDKDKDADREPVKGVLFSQFLVQ